MTFFTTWRGRGQSPTFAPSGYTPGQISVKAVKFYSAAELASSSRMSCSFGDCCESSVFNFQIITRPTPSPVASRVGLTTQRHNYTLHMGQLWCYLNLARFFCVSIFRSLHNPNVWKMKQKYVLQLLMWVFFYKCANIELTWDWQQV